MLGEDRLALIADALARWLQRFQTNINIDGDNLRCLTSNPNLQDIWQKLIRHCHPTDYVKKVKETLRIGELKERHPDRWEQHKNAQIQQGQIEQKISIRLREIYSARSEQSTNIFNELNRLQTMINDEFILISSLDKQYQIYQQLSIYLKELSRIKEQLNLFISNNRSNHQELITQLINTKIGEISDSTNLNDLLTVMNTLIQQRINQLSKIEKDDSERHSIVIDAYKFLLYVAQAKRTFRTGWVLHGVEKVESVADHMYRMAVMSFLLPTVSEESKVRYMKLALAHDLTEFDGIPKNEKHRRETEAMPSTQIERETIRLSNEQRRFITYQLTSLRTQLLSFRFKFEHNRFRLVKYNHSLKNQQQFLDNLQFIRSDQL